MDLGPPPPHRIRQGRTRMISSPLLFVTLFEKRIELFFTATHAFVEFAEQNVSD